MQQTHDEHILVVDDDAFTRQLLIRALSSAGYHCAESENGVTAWQQIHSDPPNLILLDLEMPDLDGAELLRRLRRDSDPAIAQIPTVMLTGHTDEQSEVLCLEAGADDFVTKPINVTVLRARIETHLRLSSMREQLRIQNEELERWRQTLERDLAAARLTQQSLIPQKAPAMPGWDIASVFQPVIEVGGDIYGWARMKDNRMLFWIADATGHGASAALLTTLTKLLFHYGTWEQESPANIMQAVNNDFKGIFGGRTFMTAMCVALDVNTGVATVVGAGHPPLLIARNHGTVDFISSMAPPLGLAELPQFAETSIELGHRDAFLLYTDGLFGSNDKRRRLTPERVGEFIDTSAASADALLRGVLRATPTADGTKQLPDDLAAVAVLRTG